MSDYKKRMRVLVEKEIVDNIHNDLSNTAFYFKKRIKKRMDTGDQDGIFLEMMAALTMTAFALEAILNYIGHAKEVPAWRKKSLEEKLAVLLEKLGLKPDFEARPYSTVKQLKDLRNTLAHGKPRTITPEPEEIIGTYDEIYVKPDLRSDWEREVTPEFVEIAYDDMVEIEKELFSAAKIEVMETLNGGSWTITFIDYVDDDI
ncbi:hypothetical protein [Pannonibacter phragmitetus]|uniref:hypothetical protein n=1 Tax=Pannonibacter phragmitetus TaxID=121719 RepID=UPI0013DDFB43|nr:hypothetical protein [Pannonibacter phragmitetus]